MANVNRDEEAALPVKEEVNHNGVNDLENQTAGEKTLDADKPGTGTATPSGVLSDDGTDGIKADTPPAEQEFKRPFGLGRWICVLAGLYLGAFLYGLDTTIAANVQGPILESLGEIEKLPWVGIGFPMGSLAVILLNGRLNGLFNIKVLIIAGVVIFEIGSAICGAAPNMNAMICGRIIAGIGGSMMYIGGLTYGSVYTSHKERPLFNAGIGLFWGTGCIVGPVIGGGFATSSATWRWAFYINLPLAACMAPIYIFLFPSFNPRPDLSFFTKIKSIDWVGVALNAFVFTVFQVILTLAGSSWTWHSGGIIALWVLFGVFSIIYALQQAFCIFTTPENRIFPVPMLFSRSMLLLYFGTAATATAMFVSIYYIPVFFQFTKGDTAIHSAVRLLPLIIPMVFFVMLGGATLPMHGMYMIYYVISGVFIIIGASLMHTVKSDTSVAKIYGYEVLLALGAGASAQQSYAVAAYLAGEAVHSAIGLMNVAQIGTITIALAIAGNIFENVGVKKLSAALASFDFNEGQIRDALGGSTSGILSSNDQVRTIALDAIVDTIDTIWIMAITAGALCLVSGVLMKRERLNLV